MTELEQLRKRVRFQRRELRRLNKLQQTFWSAWTYGVHIARTNDYRAKMVKAFGHEAVQKAEKSKG